MFFVEIHLDVDGFDYLFTKLVDKYNRKIC